MPPRIVLALLLVALPIARALADADDQERALSAREAGRALPLALILERARRDAPGQVLGVELEDEGGQMIYEVKVLRPDGRVRMVAYDAATGRPVAHHEEVGDHD